MLWYMGKTFTQKWFVCLQNEIKSLWGRKYMVAEQFYFSFEIGNLFLNSSSGPTQSELVIILLKHVLKEIMQIAGS